jgi:hypothetical protein
VRVVRLWSVANGKELRKFEVDQGDQAQRMNCRISGDLQTIAAVDFWPRSEPPLLQIWAASSGALMTRRPAPPCDLALFSSDNHLVAFQVPETGSGEEENKNKLIVQEATTGRQLFSLRMSHIVQLAFSPDSKTLLAIRHSSGNKDVPEICIWEVLTGRERICFRPKGWYSFVWSPDARWLATFDFENIYFWNATTGQQVGERRHPGPEFWSVRCLAFSPDARTYVTGMNDTTALSWDLPQSMVQAGLLAADLGPKELQEQWAMLAGPDASKAHKAIWTLIAAPTKSVPFLKGRLHPAAKIDRAQIQRFIDDLDNERFETRAAATKELGARRLDAEGYFRQALENKPSPEVRRRLEALLAAPFPDQPSEVLANLRAVEALEYIGSKEAVQVLDTLANGDPEAWLTKEAKAALERLKRHVGK